MSQPIPENAHTKSDGTPIHPCYSSFIKEKARILRSLSPVAHNHLVLNFLLHGAFKIE
jgi:hypothetical protein